ncbi:MAG: BREX system ATP-binding protein BrxD [Myxococcales bacterium]|nr:BREX system ATP-binding protein BrxD [Myxococcales bacterium]
MTDSTPAAASPLKRREIVEALRIGAVPRRGLELFAVGLERFERAIDEEFDAVAAGRGRFKAIRGDYGSGKTFFARWLEHRARARGFATTLVQISETETPLYKLQTLYRRAIENLQTQEWTDGAFASLIDRWLYSLEEEIIERGGINPDDPDGFGVAVGDLLERRLVDVSKTQPQYAAALRSCYAARLSGDHATEQGLIAWLMGQPNVAASLKRDAGIKGDLDSDGASGFLRGLLEVLRQTGRKGLVLVLDEVETIQRVRADSRDKSLNALRALIDDVHAGRYPGLYVLITGTPAFFDGPQGVRRLAPLAQRLETDFSGDPRFHNPRAPQIWLQPFDHARLIEVGRRVRDLYPAAATTGMIARVSDPVVELIARGVAGQLGNRVGIAPRLFLRRLVDVLDRVDEFPDFDPAKDYDLALKASEMTPEESAAAGLARTVDDIELDLAADEPAP